MKESKEEWVSFRDGCDFVSRAEPYFCEGKNASRLERHLESLGFLVLKVDCAGVNSERELLARLIEPLGSPAWFGCNWDAFGDLYDDIRFDADRVALLLSRADKFAKRDLWGFCRATEQLRLSVNQWERRRLVFETIWIGKGKLFAVEKS